MHLVQLSAGQQLLLSLPDEPLTQSLPLDGFRPGIAQTFSKEHQPGDEDIDAMLGHWPAIEVPERVAKEILARI